MALYDPQNNFHIFEEGSVPKNIPVTLCFRKEAYKRERKLNLKKSEVKRKDIIKFLDLMWVLLMGTITEPEKACIPLTQKEINQQYV